jgi:hypothetical protein
MIANEDDLHGRIRAHIEGASKLASDDEPY